MKLLLFTVLIFSLISCQTPKQQNQILRNEIEQIISDKNAVIGVSIIANAGQDTISIHGDKHFPMQSVFKFHIALAVLSSVDQGLLSLDQRITIPKEELLPGLWSPLREKNPNGGNFTIAKLIQYAVSESDNVACDVLIRLIGTPNTIENFIKKNATNDIAIVINEETMQTNWDNMFQNWTTPKAASETLKAFFEQKPKLLSPSSHDFIWKTMKETSTGKQRLRGQLPQDTPVAHKTGWSGSQKETGITDAVNDIGIVFLPDGEYFYISVFITNSKENLETNEKIIADISKAVYDFYTKEKLNK